MSDLQYRSMSKLGGHPDWLWRECEKPTAYGAAAVLAILFIGYLFPVSFLAGHGGFFEQIDASQHVAGWQFFATDSWHFPLLQTTRLNHPDGVSIAFTDSIPLAALLFKAMLPLLPAGFHYFGYWHAFAFLAQALAAVFLIRALGVRHFPGALAAAFFALTWPALLWRLGHTSLLTHAIVLLALGLYLRGREQRERPRMWIAGFITLCTTSLTVHPYFLALTYPLFLALLADRALAGEGWRPQWQRLLASAVPLATVIFLLGYAGQGSTTSFGFGEYSMNLEAPFCGGRFLRCSSAALQHQFGNYGFADATGGQYEGYNYFGLGVLLLIPLALASGWQHLRGWVVAHPTFCLLLLLFTLYALSTTIYFGAHPLLSYPFPAFMDKLTGTFRASGRFFWAASYFILFATLGAVLRRQRLLLLLVLIACALLQWSDIAQLRARVREKARLPESGDLQPWAGVLRDVAEIDIFPAFGCGDSDVNVYWFFQRLAAHEAKLLNTGYIARPNVDCATHARSFERSFMPGHLYVMSADFLKNPFGVPAGFIEASRTGKCRQWHAMVACLAHGDARVWEGLTTTAVAPIEHRIRWPASALRTQVGVVRDDELVASTGSSPGFLSFGPYVNIMPGDYRYTIEYASPAEASRAAGKWDIVRDDPAGPTLIASGSLNGTADAVQQIEGRFHAGIWSTPLEIRTHYTGDAELRLIALTLERVTLENQREQR